MVESCCRPEAVDVMVIFVVGAYLPWKVDSMYN